MSNGNRVYIISEQTKAIIGSNGSTYHRAIILEGDQERYSVYGPEQILDNSCVVYGSTLKGRRKAIKDIFTFNNKIPVPVIPMKGVYMFPTASTKSRDCVWLSFYHVVKYEPREKQTYIKFMDGSGIFVKASISTIDMQHKRTSQVIAIMNRSIFFGHNPFHWRFPPPK